MQACSLWQALRVSATQPHARLLQDFAALRLEEIDDSITVRRNRIFLLMEEVRGAREAAGRRADALFAQVRRLRIQQRLKMGQTTEEDTSKQEFKSALPLLPPLVRLQRRRLSAL